MYCLKVVEGTFLIKFGGEAMVAKPESYQESVKLSSEDAETSNPSSTPLLPIALGVVFGILAIVLIVGVLLLVGDLCYPSYKKNTIHCSPPKLPHTVMISGSWDKCELGHRATACEEV